HRRVWILCQGKSSDVKIGINPDMLHGHTLTDLYRIPVVRGIHQPPGFTVNPDPQGHLKSLDHIIVRVLQFSLVDPVTHHGNAGISHVLIKNAGQIGGYSLIKKPLYIFGQHGLMIKGLIEIPQQGPPLIVVIHDLSEHMPHVGPFIVYIRPTPASIGHAICTLQRVLILRIGTNTPYVFSTRVFAVIILHEQTFTVAGKALMNPEISHIRVRNIVSEPFMGRFVDDDKVKFQPPSGMTEIPSTISILKSIAVGHAALMFHPEI